MPVAMTAPHHVHPFFKGCVILKILMRMRTDLHAYRFVQIDLYMQENFT